MMAERNPDDPDSMLDYNKLLAQLLISANQQKKREKTKEEYEEKFKQILYKYVEVKDVEDVSSFRVIVVKLHKRYYTCSEFARPILLTCKFPLHFVKALKCLQSTDVFSNDDTYASLWSIYSLCYNATFLDEHFSAELIENGILPLITSILTNASYLSNLQNNERVINVYEVCLGAMTNLIRLQEAEDYFQAENDPNLKKALIKFVCCSHEKISSSAVVFLARIVTEAEYPLLDCCCKFIDFFVDCVDEALHTSNGNRCSLPGTLGVCFALIEVVEGLSFLSHNLKIKKRLANTKIDTLLLEIIEQQHDEKEMYFACKTLYNLLQYDRAIIVDVDQCKAILEKGKNHSSKAIQIMVEFIINLFNESDSNERSETSKISKNESNAPSDWSEIEVYAWLMCNDAESCANKMQKVTGKVLEILHKMQEHSPETLEKALTEQFELTSDEVTKFVDALKDVDFS